MQSQACPFEEEHEFKITVACKRQSDALDIASPFLPERGAKDQPKRGIAIYGNERRVIMKGVRVPSTSYDARFNLRAIHPAYDYRFQNSETDRDLNSPQRRGDLSRHNTTAVPSKAIVCGVLRLHYRYESVNDWPRSSKDGIELKI